MSKKIFTLQKSDFAESFLFINGQPLSLDDYSHLRLIYNIAPNRNVVFKWARQTSKSTTMANLMIVNAVLLPKNPNQLEVSPGGLAQLYISPSVDQTKIFSHYRISPALESPFIKKHYLHPNLVQNVFNKEFLNKAVLYLRYAYHDATRLRGLSTDIIYYDEAQDLYQDQIPVINQTMSRSYYKWNIFSGTPRRTMGTLAYYWYRSTQNEWIVKCYHCQRQNFIDDKNIGLNGPICRFCGKPIDTRNGQWVRTSSTDPNDYYEGFRVHQLMFYGAPWIDWEKDILAPYNNWPRALFFNEILALEYDEGTSPISLEQLKICCSKTPLHEEPTNEDLSYKNYMGIDYGPSNSLNSFTLITIIQHQPKNITKVIYAKRFQGKEASFDFIHDEIPRLAKKWKISLLGADYGLGEASNAELGKRVGKHKIVAYQHLGKQKNRIVYNVKMQAYTTSRNKVMTEFFQKIRDKKYIFPEYLSFESFTKDILATTVEVDEKKGVYKYVNSEPDDTIHSLIYAELVAELGDVIY